jgi:hypothetical protein
MKNENYNLTINTNASAKSTVKSICNVAGWWTINIERFTGHANAGKKNCCCIM